GDLEHPDELRIDLDPGPGVAWSDVRRVALEVKALLDEVGLRGFPKTSGSRGMHVNVRLEPRWTFSDLRRAALALSREIERRAPAGNSTIRFESMGRMGGLTGRFMPLQACVPRGPGGPARFGGRACGVSVGDLHVGRDEVALGAVYELTERS